MDLSRCLFSEAHDDQRAWAREGRSGEGVKVIWNVVKAPDQTWNRAIWSPDTWQSLGGETNLKDRLITPLCPNPVKVISNYCSAEFGGCSLGRPWWLSQHYRGPEPRSCPQWGTWVCSFGGCSSGPLNLPGATRRNFHCVSPLEPGRSRRALLPST